MKIPSLALLAYSTTAAAVEMAIVPVIAILPSTYTAGKVGGLAAFGTALLLSRLMYALSAQVVGYASDRIATPFGRRKPWIVVGGLITAISCYVLYTPPANAGALYFGLASSLAYIGFSLIDIPYAAWGAEMTDDYAERARISAYRSVATNVGIIALFSLPLSGLFGGTNLLDHHVIAGIGKVVTLLVLACALIAAFFGPPAPHRLAPQRIDLRKLVGGMMRNVPFIQVAVAMFCSFTGTIVVSALALPFMSEYHVVAAYSIAGIITPIASIAATKPWLSLTYRIGKDRAWALSLWISAVLSPPLWFLLLALVGAFWASIITSIVGGALLAGTYSLFPWSVLGDLVDYDHLRTHENHAANYAAVLGLTIRISNALGGAIGFWALSAAHYTIGGTNTPSARTGLFLAYFGINGLCMLASVAALHAYPLTPKRMEIVRRRVRAYELH